MIQSNLLVNVNQLILTSPTRKENNALERSLHRENVHSLFFLVGKDPHEYKDSPYKIRLELSDKNSRGNK
jgi:hypothetical protein